MSLDDAMKKLARARRPLAGGQGRLARRNARRRMLGALLAVRHALDKEYPPLPKDKATAKPKAKQCYAFRLPFGRVFDAKQAILFMQLVTGPPVVPVFLTQGNFAEFTCKEGRMTGECTYAAKRHLRAYVRLRAKDRAKWSYIIHLTAHALSGHGAHDAELAEWEEKVVALWRQFFLGPLLPTADLELVAAHQLFLEKRGRA